MYAIAVREDGAPEVMEWATTADPVPGPGEVLIDVAAAECEPRRPIAKGRETIHLRQVQATSLDWSVPARSPSWGQG